MEVNAKKLKSIEKLSGERDALLAYLDKNGISTRTLKYHVNGVDISHAVEALYHAIEAQGKLIEAQSEKETADENADNSTKSLTKKLTSMLINSKLAVNITGFLGLRKLDEAEASFLDKFNKFKAAFNKAHSEVYFNHRKFFTFSARIKSEIKLIPYNRDRLDSLLTKEAARRLGIEFLPESFAKTITSCQTIAHEFAESYVFASSYNALKTSDDSKASVKSCVDILPVPFVDAETNNNELVSIGCVALSNSEKQIFKYRVKEAIKTRVRLSFSEVLRSINQSDPDVTLEYLKSRDAILTKCERAFGIQGKLFELAEDFTLANISGKKLSQSQNNDYKNKLESLKSEVGKISDSIDALVKGETKEDFWKEIQATARKVILNQELGCTVLTQVKDLRDFFFIEETGNTVRQDSGENIRGRVKTDIVKKAIAAERQKTPRILSPDPQSLAKTKTKQKSKSFGGAAPKEDENDDNA